MQFRIGSGFDVHRLADGLPLVLGGVRIPFEKGLEGHSDADVLVHAVIDALLGSLALGDIGSLFPDSDLRYRGINGLVLLKQVWRLVREKDFQLGNLDSILIAESPKLSPFLDDMRSNLAESLECKKDLISIKATTTEKLGFTGRGEGIAAQTVVLLRGKN